VLDTNVALDLLWFRDRGCDALRDALRQQFAVAITDTRCRAEWQRVLGYPQLRLEPTQQAAMRAAYDETVWLLPESRLESQSAIELPRCSDPDDQKFLELSHRAGARWLLTRDEALLTLSRRTRQSFGFEVIEPRTLRAALDSISRQVTSGDCG
jgi:predicted nucleic acid-binding protein